MRERQALGEIRIKLTPITDESAQMEVWDFQYRRFRPGISELLEVYPIAVPMKDGEGILE